jgi:hypothetical protein
MICPHCGQDITLGAKSQRFDFDFERLYRLFPRKAGKMKGLEQCQKQIRTQQDYDALEQAIMKYAGICQAEQRDARYIMHFSKFMGRVDCPYWKEFLDEDAGQGGFNISSDPLGFLRRKKA